MCIKVKINENHKDLRVDREVKYYKKIQKKNIKNPFWAKYHGTVDTNLGTGYVFDLVKDEASDNVSKTVSEYLNMENSPITHKNFEDEFLKIKNEMIKHKVIVRDITGRNVCCKILDDNSIKLIIIDGIGHRDFIPLVEYFQFLAERKINKIYNIKGLESMVKHKMWLNK